MEIETIKSLGYSPCPDDENFAWCDYCGKKTYIGNNPTDRERHEIECEYR